MPAKAKSESTYISHHHWSVVFLRLTLGWLFIYAGYSKVITFFTAAPDWTADGFLKASQGPFGEFFHMIVGSPIVSYLNAYGLLLIGVAIFLGVLVRWASLCGAILMFLYWAAVFSPEHAFIVDDHIIYLVAFIVLATVDAGRTLGIDALIEKTDLVKNHPWLKMPLG